MRPAFYSLSLLLSLALTALAPSAFAATSGDNGTHDPSRMMVSEGKFYVYSTGFNVKSSSNGLLWKNEPSLFPNGFPQWVKTLLPNNQGLWAPDLIHLNGQYYLYYSVAADKPCAIGLITSPTLNPAADDYKWTDRGLVVSNDSKVTYATIDAAPILDQEGQLWLLWGSNYTHDYSADAIWITRLDNATGLPSKEDSAYPGHPLIKNHVEGSYMHYHDGFYYLFWNSGGCCSGTSSTYKIHVSRAQSVTGPFTEDRTFYQSQGNVHGPGHMGIYSACGVERFTYHFYPSNRSILGENELLWGNDGWPVVGPESTSPISACEDPILGTGGTTGSGGETGGGGVASAGGATSGAGGATGGTTSVGNGGATGGDGVVQTGGSPTSGGAGNEDDAGTSTTGDNAGCACSLPGGPATTGLWQVFGAGVALALTRLRRRER